MALKGDSWHDAKEKAASERFSDAAFRLVRWNV